jgi:hypothetical protein
MKTHLVQGNNMTQTHHVQGNNMKTLIFNNVFHTFEANKRAGRSKSYDLT